GEVSFEGRRIRESRHAGSSRRRSRTPLSAAGRSSRSARHRRRGGQDGRRRSRYLDRQGARLGSSARPLYGRYRRRYRGNSALRARRPRHAGKSSTAGDPDSPGNPSPAQITWGRHGGGKPDWEQAYLNSIWLACTWRGTAARRIVSTPPPSVRALPAPNAVGTHSRPPVPEAAP